jgi:hypothetical protein
MLSNKLLELYELDNKKIVEVKIKLEKSIPSFASIFRKPTNSSSMNIRKHLTKACELRQNFLPLFLDIS